MSYLSDISANIKSVKEKIERACDLCRRDPKSVKLIGVTKGKPVSAIIEAYHAGLFEFGENYAQELRKKAEEIHSMGLSPTWHFIGGIQTNKIKYIINIVSSIHSIDRISLIHEVGKRMPPDKIVDCYIEVNIGGEESKSGVEPEGVISICREILKYQSMRLTGLMCIPPYSDNPEDSRPYFSRLRTLRDRLREELETNDPHILSELSMGMSNDFEVAIQEGATVIRIGTAIFGPR